MDAHIADLETVAAALYALPLGEFVAARTVAEKAARAAGRRDLAAAIHELAKPSAAAGLVNRLARAHPDDVRSLLDLGAALRTATAARDGARLRELSTQRNRQVGELLARARGLAADAGARVTDDTARGVEETLRSALADPVLGEQLAAGRLTEVLQHSGFPGLFGAEPDDAPAPPRPGGDGPSGPKSAERRPDGGKAARRGADTASSEAPANTAQAGTGKPDAAARRLGAAAARRDAARSEAESAGSALDGARALADACAAEVAELDSEAARLRAALDRVQADRERAVGHERRARVQLATAERAARATDRRLAEATEAHDRLASEPL